MLPRTFVFAGFLGVWCRAFRARIVYMLPRAMVPQARPNGLVVSAWCRSLHGAAHLYAAAHQCCRALVVRPRTCMLPRIHGAARLCAPRTFVCGRPVLCIAAHSFGATHG